MSIELPKDAEGREIPLDSFVDIDDLLSELLDRRVYDSEVAIDACEALGIADLIDRPTCHLVEDEDGRTA